MYLGIIVNETELSLELRIVVNTGYEMHNTHHSHLREIYQSSIIEIRGSFFDECKIGEVIAKIGDTRWVTTTTKHFSKLWHG